MREIKFRAWNVITKTMIDLKKMTPLALNMDTDGLFIPFSDGLPLMQYTGLKDKNGKEIYEGDIVKEGGRLSTVRFSKSYARFELEIPTGRAGLYGFYGEVVGNKYENRHQTVTTKKDAL